ncbi:MAG: DUF1236 domain-containing protein [Mesorhizobium sp.]|nr:DUF1236 domain-containing protein [Mesorhizobium sp.]
MIHRYALPLAAFAFAAATGIASAQSGVTATTDLNVRGGPGPQYPVIGMIPAGGPADLSGCLDNSKWCQVSTSGGPGWVYSDYLTIDRGGTAAIVTESRAEVPVVTYEQPQGGGGAVAGGATGAVAGAIVAGPIGAVVGGVAGAAIGGTAEGLASPPPDKVVTYVRSNQVEPVYLDGEVVVGASLPETVTLAEVPDYEYRYVYVNGQPVLVEPQSRRIVYVVR